ncbi:cleavage and polyadenylation specificity factor subunit 3-II, partial [Selaginella moellendorffii]
MTIKCVPLGAGQDVGKSCVIVSMGGKKIMFDCGMHMGYQDERRFPDFSQISKTGDFTHEIDCVIVTHFHLDHVGALPYFTEVCGYEGPVYMTYPTKALAPIMLEDYRKIMVDRRGEEEQFSTLHIQQCMKKVIAVDLRQTIRVSRDLAFRAYYAGHVLGAAMFYVKAGNSTVVYTGDYNMTPDRHLGAAQIDRLKPDLLITESTYATTIRESRLAKEAEFLNVVHTCVSKGGKVLIPISALGRAQELCILLDEYWERMNLKVPIYFSAGLTMQSNAYYKLLISWTNQRIKDTYVTRNAFDFKHVFPFDRTQLDGPGPCILFATPGMLTGGLSLEVLKHWAPVEQNLLIIPGFCLAGTVAQKLCSGKPTRVEVDKRTTIDVRCQIHLLAFSAHTDAKGIMDLVRQVEPHNVILVHGEKLKMDVLKARINNELGIPCHNPANHDVVEVPSHCLFNVEASKELVSLSMSSYYSSTQSAMEDSMTSDRCKPGIPVEGIVLTTNSSKIKLVHPFEVPSVLGEPKHDISFSSEVEIILEEEESEAAGKQSHDAATEPSSKRVRKDLKRTLSLDLERLPEEAETESEHPKDQKFLLDINEVPVAGSPEESQQVFTPTSEDS